jgi:hypothetical protein
MLGASGGSTRNSFRIFERKRRGEILSFLFLPSWGGGIRKKLTDDADDFRLGDTLSQIGDDGVARDGHVSSRRPDGVRQIG